MTKSRGSSNHRRKARGNQASPLPPRPPLPHAISPTEWSAASSDALPDDSFQRTTKQLIRFGTEKQAGRRTHGKWVLVLLWVGVGLAMFAACFAFVSGV